MNRPLHQKAGRQKPRPILLATENLAELRARARTALDLSDPSLELDCLMERTDDTQPRVRFVHRPTGLAASAGRRADDARTKLVALVRLRDALYDLIQGNNKRGPRRRLKRR